MEGRGSAPTAGPVRRLAISHLVLASLLAPLAHLAPLCLLACADGRRPRAATAPALAPASAIQAGQDAQEVELRVTKQAPAAAPGGIVLALSRPLDPGSLDLPASVQAFVDRDGNPGGAFEPLAGRAVLDATGRELTFLPDAAPAAGREVRLVLGGALVAAGAPGQALQAGRGSAPLSFTRDAPQGVFEARQVTAAASAAAGAGDDHSDGPAGATPLAGGATARGRIDVAGDQDWFRLALRAGEEVTLLTLTSGETTLALWAPDGRTLLGRNDDDPQGGRSSRLVHRAAQSGEHLVAVAGFGDATPEYGLQASLAGPPGAPAARDDHADGPSGATPLAVGGSSIGAIGTRGDRDWFALRLAAGQTVELATVTTGDTTLAAYDRDGASLLGENDDDPQGGGRHSRLRLSAVAAGTYFAVVGGYGSSTPTWRLEARDVPPPPASLGLPDPDRFRLQAGTDPWQVDFALRRDLWEQDLRAHGLRSGDPATDALMEARVIDQTLSWTSRLYGRSADGADAPRAFRISFTRQRPAGLPGRGFSREAVGGRHQDGGGTLGVSWLDPGNRRKEDNATLGELGIFSASIWGRGSSLSPALTAGDRPYLDGTYRLGDGTAAQDRRFERVRAVAADWAHALAVVLAHEVGHSVGLEHDEADADSIMHPTLSRWVLSDAGTAFSSTSAAELERTLGRSTAP